MRTTRVEVRAQEELRPILLRRMKEDVEDLPQKEEIVVRVQLTQQQRSFYKAIFAKQARSRCCHPSSTSTVPAAQQLPAGLTFLFPLVPCTWCGEGRDPPFENSHNVSLPAAQDGHNCALSGSELCDTSRQLIHNH